MEDKDEKQKQTIRQTINLIKLVEYWKQQTKFFEMDKNSRIYRK